MRPSEQQKRKRKEQEPIPCGPHRSGWEVIECCPCRIWLQGWFHALHGNEGWKKAGGFHQLDTAGLIAKADPQSNGDWTILEVGNCPPPRLLSQYLGKTKDQGKPFYFLSLSTGSRSWKLYLTGIMHKFRRDLYTGQPFFQKMSISQRVLSSSVLDSSSSTCSSTRE